MHHHTAASHVVHVLQHAVAEPLLADDGRARRLVDADREADAVLRVEADEGAVLLARDGDDLRPRRAGGASGRAGAVWMVWMVWMWMVWMWMVWMWMVQMWMVRMWMVQMWMVQMWMCVQWVGRGGGGVGGQGGREEGPGAAHTWAPQPCTCTCTCGHGTRAAHATGCGWQVAGPPPALISWTMVDR